MQEYQRNWDNTGFIRLTNGLFSGVKEARKLWQMETKGPRYHTGEMLLAAFTFIFLREVIREDLGDAGNFRRV